MTSFFGYNLVVSKFDQGGFHESYHGERSAEAISAFSLKALEDVQAGRTFDDDDSYSRKHTRGCRIDGHIKVRKDCNSMP